MMQGKSELNYLNLCQRVINEGHWVKNERTGKRCLTIINADLEYDVESDFPILTTKKTFWKSAVAELQGYLIGLDNAADFRALGTKTWDMNANETEAWLNNPNRKGHNDIGMCYGVVAKNWNGLDLIQQVVDNLSAGIDNRGEMFTFWNPSEFDKACLRPCMYSHHFSILDGTLYLSSTQRSVDVPLGLPFNSIQCYVLLKLMAKITGLKAGKAYHKLVNVHIYEDQIEMMKVQINRQPKQCSPKFTISDKIQDYDDLFSHRLIDECDLVGYEHHDAIKFPFSA